MFGRSVRKLTGFFLLVGLSGPSAHAELIGEVCGPRSGRDYQRARIAQTLQKFFPAGSANCENCGTTGATSAPPSSFADVLVAPPRTRGQIEDDMRCVRASQREFLPRLQAAVKRWPREPFIDCVSTTEPVRKSIAAVPCSTDAYLELISRIFREGAACTEVPVQEVYPLFAHESGFFENVRSGTNAAGIGQLTMTAVNEVMQWEAYPWLKNAGTRDLGRLDSKMMANPACRIFEGIQVPMKMTPAHKCEMMAFPQNPAMNLVIAMKYYALRRASALDMAEASPILARYSAADRTRIAIEGTYYNYNAGNWAPARLIAFIGTRAPSESLTEIFAAFAKYLADPATEIPPKIGRDEVSNYVRGVRGVAVIRPALEKLRGKGTKECFAD